MPLRIALQMDPIASVKLETDSSVFLANEAQQRGHALYYYNPESLSIDNGKIIALVSKLTLSLGHDPFFSLTEAVWTDLSTMDVLLVRQDPPFDMGYITSTYFLDLLPASTLIINRPSQIRDCPEKLFTWQFRHFMPPTLISQSFDPIQQFFQAHAHDVVLKPLYAFAGNDVFRNKSLHELKHHYDFLMSKYQLPVIVQTYLPNITKGDKRILLIDGEVAAALNRIPKEGQLLSNIAQGGTAAKTTLTAKEHAICDALKPELKKRGLFLAGIDVIDGHLTEINTTSPTGLLVIKRLYDLNLATVFWDKVEEKKKG